VPPASHLLAFAALSLALIIVPGPSVLFVITRSLQLGRAAGLAVAAGGQLGEYAQVVAVALGLGVLVERSAVIFSAVKLAGAGYLVYLGVQAIRNRRSLAAALTADPARRTTSGMLRDGFVVGLTNPKSVVFFVAVLPQFADRAAGHLPAQLLLLGAIFVAIAVVSDGLWALGAGSARSWLARSPRRLEVIGGTSGLVMIGIGAALALTGRKD
jgi:threonine/homoserine/homoserine lactone efflux protein